MRQPANAYLVPRQHGRGQPGEPGRGRSAATTDFPFVAKECFTCKKGECRLCWEQCQGGSREHRTGNDTDILPTGGFPARPEMR